MRCAFLRERAVRDRGQCTFGSLLLSYPSVPAMAPTPGKEIRDTVALDFVHEGVALLPDKVSAETGQTGAVGGLRIRGLEGEPLRFEPIEQCGHADGP